MLNKTYIKILRWIVLMLIIVSTSHVFAEPCGDVNSNGVIDIVDALLVAQHYVGLNPENFDASVADVNEDGVIDILDALLIAQYYVGLVPSLPECGDTPESVTYEMQAEEAQYSSGGVETNHDGYTGTGFVNTDNALDEWIEWSFDLSADSTAECVFRYASEGDARSMDLSINGSDVTNLVFPASGAWNTWASQTTGTVTLSAGLVTIRLTATTSGGAPNMDKMDITITGGVIVAPTETPDPTPTPTLDPNATPTPTIDTSVIFSITDNLFDSSQPGTLGLSEATGTETINVFTAADDTDHYSNGAVLIPFKDILYIMWQSSAEKEDTADTWVAYSSSPDGVNWSAPRHLEVNSDGSPYDPGYARSSGGWWTDGSTLVAYINAWPGYDPRGGDVYYRTSSDGESWSQASRLTDNNGNPVYGIFEQDPHLLPSGRILSAVHVQSGGEGSGGLFCYPYYTDDPMGISGWTRASMPHISSNSNNMSAELEPSSFIRADGGIVMVFRDQNSSFKKLASLSTDNGATWTKPIETNMPDSRSKQSAGNLPGGTAYQVSNPSGNKDRYPLVLTLSQDGKVFDRAYLLRSLDDLPPRKYPASYSGFSYPKSTIWKGYLYVGYSVNKEDIDISRVPITSLE